jgi:hypothetical protein
MHAWRRGRRPSDEDGEALRGVCAGASLQEHLEAEDEEMLARMSMTDTRRHPFRRLSAASEIELVRMTPGASLEPHELLDDANKIDRSSSAPIMGVLIGSSPGAGSPR